MSKKNRVGGFFADLGIVVLVLVILFVAFIGFGHVNTNRWYNTLFIASQSMEPTLKLGDLIVITRPPYNYQPQIGKIISFQVKGSIITHRIVGVNENGSLVTQGDACNVPDYWEDNYQVKKVGGLYWFKIPYLGYADAYATKFLRVTLPKFFGGKVNPWVKNSLNRIADLITGSDALFASQDKITCTLAAAVEPTVTENIVQTEAIVEETTEEKVLTIDSFVINNDDISTLKPEVILTIKIPDGQDLTKLQMRIANDSESWADENTGWEAYSDTKNWQLSEDEGEKQVFIQIKDESGNLTTASDSITLEKEKMPEETSSETTDSTPPENSGN